MGDNDRHALAAAGAGHDQDVLVGIEAERRAGIMAEAHAVLVPDRHHLLIARKARTLAVVGHIGQGITA